MVAAITATLVGASAVPTPLYAIYQERWALSTSQSTLAFGVYAISLLLALLTVGSLSDQIGRRPVIVAALALEALSMAAFAGATGLELLLVARVVQGFATGAAISALGSALVDLEASPGHGARINSSAHPTGLAVGALFSSIVSEHFPRPTSTVFLVLLFVFAVEIAAALMIPETVPRRRDRPVSIRPRVTVPRPALGAFLLTVPYVVAVWALAGFYLSLGPSLARNALHVHTSLVGAAMVATLTGTGAVSIFVLRAVGPRTILLVGAGTLVAGVATTLYGSETSSAIAILTGTAIAGVGFGAGFQSAIRTVMPLAQPHERAALLSSVYTVAYLASCAPSLVAGSLIDRLGFIATTRIYAGLVASLATTAFVGLAFRRNRAEMPRAVDSPANTAHSPLRATHTRKSYNHRP
ncbi:major facilitator superfamily transporter multidrug resistance protein [Rhodococcus opacus PD630]|nr:MFS transporter [Rhodococcus opacus]EHI45348.1 major facilitator superfamily transporter multidrug resistance protein [Rhodococcus opacus PD630]UDH00959.1 MFS transporter [Rhodococcus opacus PD630]